MEKQGNCNHCSCDEKTVDLQQKAYAIARELFPIHPGGVTDVRDIPQIERNRATYALGFIRGWKEKDHE